MIVYGQRELVRSPRRDVADIIVGLRLLGGDPPGVRRHMRAVSLLLAAGELAQALADHAFAARGRDGVDGRARTAMTLTLALARIVWRSHRAAYARLGGLAPARAAAHRLRRKRLPRQVLARGAEGYEHYALYPEAYALAARALGPRFRPIVIGLRSIGVTLAAMVAAATRARALPITVRPIGHPFARTLSLSRTLAARLRAARRRTFAIADEGPGLSGSSFIAALDALATAGVPPDNVHLFPSHAGLGGSVASEAVRARLAASQRHHVAFEDAFLTGGRVGLAAWTRDVTGPLRAPPEDIAGGRWRRHVFGGDSTWPAADPPRERRKYLLRGARGVFVARFAGLGRSGEARHARAVALAASGLCPTPAGLRHGFLLQPWLADARPLAGAGALVSRARLVATLADYLTLRATLRADAGRGAPPARLLAAAIANAGEALGAGAAALGRLEAWADDVARDATPVEVDARLHVWEWLVTPQGRLVKTDAIDHCDGHDFVGCQDIAWDVAAAGVELALARDEQEVLRRLVRSRGAPVASESLAFHRVCYVAFQLGSYRMAAGAMAASDPCEAGRLDREAARYLGLLAGACAALDRPGAALPP